MVQLDRSVLGRRFLPTLLRFLERADLSTTKRNNACRGLCAHNVDHGFGIMRVDCRIFIDCARFPASFGRFPRTNDWRADLHPGGKKPTNTTRSKTLCS